MAARTIETRAVISAQDQTGNTFAAVAQKLKKMESAAEQASHRMQSAARFPAQQVESSMRRAMTSAVVVNAVQGGAVALGVERRRATHHSTGIVAPARANPHVDVRYDAARNP